MKVPYSWLSEFVDIDGIDPKDIVDRLTLCSVEASLSTFDVDIDGVVFGKVVQVKELSKGLYCKVQVGEHAFVNVYTSDRGLKEGVGVLVALPNAKVNGMCITKREFEGVISEGMLLSAQELGLESHSEGVLKIEEEFPLGASAYDLLGFGEPIIELEITPNRGDLLSVRGLARELCALFNLKRKHTQEQAFEEFGELDIRILDGDCLRYTGALIEGVEVRESPLWLKRRLWQVGARSINNVVDITNYILFRDGQPLHAFDYDKIVGGIRVRSAKKGEKILTLMGSERELTPVNLIIADEEKPLAIAGVVGGLDSSMSFNTRNVLLESAYFDPYRIRRSAKSLNVSTDSSYRFERGVDIEGVRLYQSSAVKLMLEVCKGQLTAIKDVYPKPYEPRRVYLSLEKFRRYSGEEMDPQRMAQILNSLDIPSEVVGEGVQALIPSHRSFDMSSDVDLIEELLRLKDYNTLSDETLLTPSKPTELSDMRERVRDYLVSNGLYEVITFSFEDSELYKLMGLASPRVELLNPLTKSQSLMRTSLIPSLLKTYLHNVHQGIRDAGIFEIGKVYHEEGEEERLGILLAGYKSLYPEEEFSAYELLRLVQGVLKIMGKDYTPEGSPPTFLHPYAGVSFDGGFSGELHPKISKELRLGRVFVAELLLRTERPPTPRYSPISKYPPVIRDLSLIVDKNLPVNKLITHIRKVEPEVVESVKVFSIYTDPTRFGEGKKSVSVRLVLRSKERSLSDGEANALVEKIVGSLEEELGARLR